MARAAAVALGLTADPRNVLAQAAGIPDAAPLVPLNLSTPLNEISARLSDAIPRLLIENNVPGASLALIREGKVVWSDAYGLKSAESDDAVDSRTIFEAASLTKPVFATVVMQLVEEGKLDLDTPLAKYAGDDANLQYAEDPAVQAKLSTLTARHALTHMTGLPNWRNQKPLDFMHEPATRWSYSGEGYVYLQRVVEHMEQRPVDELIRERVLVPLGLKLTSAIWREDYETLSADSHSFKGKSRGKDRPAEANVASSLHTTAEEYARFMTTFFKTNRSTESILQPATIEQILTPQVEIDEDKVRGRIAWGLGWGLQRTIGETDDGTAFWHWGSNRGFKSFCIGYPEHGLGAAIFTNADRGWKVHRAVIPEIVGGDQTALMWKL